MFSNSWPMRSISLHCFKVRKQSYVSEVVIRKHPHCVYAGSSSPCSSSASLCGALRSFSSTQHSRVASASISSSSSPSLNMYGGATAEGEVCHLDRSYQMIPKKLTIGKKIAVRSYLDRNRTELSDRVYTPQKTWFMPYGVETKFSREKTRMTAANYATSQTLQCLPVEELRDRPFCYHHHQLYNLETKLVWKAFDTPELIGIFLHDTCIHLQTCSRTWTTTPKKDIITHGADGGEKSSSSPSPPRVGSPGYGGHASPFSYHFDVYSEYFLKKAYQYTMESRYWRCLGITKPFFDAHTLRAHCWEDNGLQVGTVVFSQAMRHALMDLERAVRRRELGLEPNYVWDRWGPSGFVDGSRMDYLPRFRHNPYRDPDGVEVTEQDIVPYNTHRAIKERYGAFIFPDMEAFVGVFAAPTHGGLSALEDIPSAEAVALFKRLQQNTPTAETELRNDGLREGEDRPFFLSPLDLRILLYLSAAFTVTAAAATSTPMSSSPVLDIASKWLSSTTAATCWEDVREEMRPVLEEQDEKVNAARLLQNTRHHPDRVRAFFEEKCGFVDFMNTPDKVITGAVLAYLEELRRVCVETSWGASLARALTDVEKARVMGDGAFLVYRHIEDAVLDKKRKAWTARFSGEANEEHTLDYLLENFGRRVGSTSSASSSAASANVGTTGEEFDREQEPIGRQVQRRVLDSDKANKLAEVRKSRGRMWSKKKSVFDSLHQKQLQNFNYGVR